MLPQVNLLIDSGAFSAFTRGQPVDIDKYSAFLHENKEFAAHAISLDYIDPVSPEHAAAEGMRNYFYLRDKGHDKIIPVYHVREQIKWLDQMIAAGAEYVGISATSIVSQLESKVWHNIVWNHITDQKGRAIIQTHALGDTEETSLMTRPWTSSDSATWMLQAGMAARVKLQGKSYQLRSTMLRDTAFISVDDPPEKKEAWEIEIRRLGLNPDKLMSALGSPSEIAMMRSFLVASDLMHLQAKSAHVTRFKRTQDLLETKPAIQLHGKDREGACRVYMAMSPSAWMYNLPILAMLEIKNVLVSFHYVATAPKVFMQERLIPFLYDPIGFCNDNPKLRRYTDKLREVMIKPL